MFSVTLPIGIHPGVDILAYSFRGLAMCLWGKRASDVMYF
jgi:hypothetical protein